MPKNPIVFALVAALVASTGGCADGLGGFLISDQDELEMGIGVDEEIEKEYFIADEGDPVTSWARGLVDNLSANSTSFRDPSDFGGYKVEVIVDNELVNAFAAPGGFTYITTGLILEAGSCAEIAGVMGHELGHVTERHAVKKIESAFGATQLAGLFLGEGLAADAAVTIWAVLQQTQFSQDDETEADVVGLQISYRSGYNPYGLADFFQRLAELEGSQVIDLSFLSSHPKSSERVSKVDAEIQSRYDDVVRGQSQTYECIGTQMTLQQIQDHIRAGVAVRPGTGQGGPSEPPPEEG